MARRRRGKQTPQQIALGIGLPVIVVFVYFASRGGSTSLLHIFPLIVFLVVVAVVVVVGFALLAKIFSTKPLNHTWQRPPHRQPQSDRHIPSYGSRPANYNQDLPPNSPPELRSRALTEETLRKMDWLAFEHLVVELFTHLGFAASKTGAGPDGGVDIELRPKDAARGAPPQVLVQCKARGNSAIGVDKARELYGVMAARGVRSGILICNTSFTSEAWNFANANKGLRLADLSWILAQVAKVPTATREEWEARYLADDDYDVPSCPACEIKLVRINGRQGEFWGCRNYPRCRAVIPMRTEAKRSR
jgi:restriction system protein